MKNYVLITGASEGFGVELAKVFSKNAHNTILIARSLDKIKKLADEIKKDYKTDSRAYKCNISNSSDIDRIIKNIKNQKLNVDILVNNAGISNFGEFSNNSDDDIIEILRVNVIGMTYLTKKIVDGMINNKSGKILNISSIVGYYPLPYQAVYAASKAYSII